MASCLVFSPHLLVAENHKCFLNDVEEGGATTFPVPGINVNPLKGAAVMWWNTYPNGTLDKTSAHGGLPVLKGVKYAAVQWMRERVVT